MIAIIWTSETAGKSLLANWTTWFAMSFSQILRSQFRISQGFGEHGIVKEFVEAIVAIYVTAA
jgi:hypothetical protein